MSPPPTDAALPISRPSWSRSLHLRRHRPAHRQPVAALLRHPASESTPSPIPTLGSLGSGGTGRIQIARTFRYVTLPQRDRTSANGRREACGRFAEVTEVLG